jgi:hypothetical protein
VRALASFATHQDHQVFVIDADERKNIDRWPLLLDRFGNKPANLEIVAVTTPTLHSPMGEGAYLQAAHPRRVAEVSA